MFYSKEYRVSKIYNYAIERHIHQPQKMQKRKSIFGYLTDKKIISFAPKNWLGTKDERLQKVSKWYKKLQKVIKGYKRLQKLIKGYKSDKKLQKGTQGYKKVTKGYKGLQKVTNGYKWLQKVT